jgi:hypothetical protein
MWPTLCVLKGSDGSINHAVAIVEEYIFDSNNLYAMPLTTASLDWCCSGEGEEVQFVKLIFAYCFYRHNPKALGYTLLIIFRQIHLKKNQLYFLTQKRIRRENPSD